MRIYTKKLLINTNNQSSIIVIRAERFGIFVMMVSRFPLQSCKPNPGLQGFPLQSGLKIEILHFCHDSKKKSK
jgi:hypothetical protein